MYVVDNESIARLMKKEDDFTTVLVEEITQPVVQEKPSMMGGPHGGSHGKSYSAPHGGGFH